MRGEDIAMESLVTIEKIEKKILLIRDHKVMLDADLAELYGVETKQLKRAVRRNEYRFPPDFMFQLTREEYDSLRSQFGTLKRGEHSKYLPMVFTEQGVAMLSSVLNSRRAIKVNIMIMRAFVSLRWMVSSNKALLQKLEEMERKYDKQFKIVFEAIRQLMTPPETKKRKIGFDLKEKQARYGKKRGSKEFKRYDFQKGHGEGVPAAIRSTRRSPEAFFPIIV
jgi:hypothetical protein